MTEADSVGIVVNMGVAFGTLWMAWNARTSVLQSRATQQSLERQTSIMERQQDSVGAQTAALSRQVELLEQQFRFEYVPRLAIRLGQHQYSDDGEALDAWQDIPANMDGYSDFYKRPTWPQAMPDESATFMRVTIYNNGRETVPPPTFVKYSLSVFASPESHKADAPYKEATRVYRIDFPLLPLSTLPLDLVYLGHIPVAELTVHKITSDTGVEWLGAPQSYSLRHRGLKKRSKSPT